MMSECSISDTASEPEPGDGQRRGPVTVSGVTQIGESSTPYTVYADIIPTHENANVLSELRLIEQDGQWVMQEPEVCQQPEICVQTKDDQDAFEVQATLRELEALEALENIGARNIPFPITSDGALSGSTECHQSPGVTHSPSSQTSSDQDHVSSTSVTPPRHEPFVFEPHSELYPGRNQIVQQHNDWGDILRDALNGNACQEDVLAEILVPSSEKERLDDETPDRDEDRQGNVDNDQVEDNQGIKKGRRRNKKKEEVEKKKAEKEQKRSLYDQAVNAFKEHKYESYSACAKAYGVSDVTLRRIILRKKGFSGQGRKSDILTKDEEKKLVSHLKYCAKVGFGLSIYDVQLLIQELLSAVVR